MLWLLFALIQKNLYINSTINNNMKGFSQLKEFKTDYTNSKTKTMKKQ